MENFNNTQDFKDKENRKGDDSIILDAERQEDKCLRTLPSKKGDQYVVHGLINAAGPPGGSGLEAPGTLDANEEGLEGTVRTVTVHAGSG